MKRLRWGILGTGNIARQFAEGVRASGSESKSQLVAVGSRSMESARSFAAVHNIAEAVGGYDELLRRQDVEAIYLSLPNTMHAEWTIRALRAGKHVLCEKPLAVSVAEAEAMAGAARDSGRVLIEAFMYLAHPQTLKLMELVRDGAIGRVRHVRTSFCYRVRNHVGNIRFDPNLAGGALMDVGCYCISFAQRLARAEPSEVHAVSTQHVSGVDEVTTVVMKFPCGMTSEFTCGMMLQTDNSAFVCGEEGFLRVPIPWKPPPGRGEVIQAYSTPPKQDSPGSKPLTPEPIIHRIADDRPLYGIEADAFADAVLNHALPFISIEESLAIARTIERVRRAIA